VPLPPYPFEGRRYWIDADPFTGGALPVPFSNEEKPANVNDNDNDNDNVNVNAGTTDDYSDGGVGPGDDVEQAVLEVYRQFLGHRRISIYDNFFDLRGDSLVATRMLARLQEIYPVEVPLESFFEKPTVSHLAGLIKERLLEKVNTLSEEELKNLI
jgi:acyl carrier protein